MPRLVGLNHGGFQAWLSGKSMCQELAECPAQALTPKGFDGKGVVLCTRLEDVRRCRKMSKYGQEVQKSLISLQNLQIHQIHLGTYQLPRCSTHAVGPCPVLRCFQHAFSMHRCNGVCNSFRLRMRILDAQNQRVRRLEDDKSTFVALVQKRIPSHTHVSFVYIKQNTSSRTC